MNIYIVRHGETSKEKVFNLEGYPDAGLTKIGMIQANLTGEHLSKVHFDAIYSSDLQRAQQTAEVILSFQSNQKVTIDKRIREIHMGIFHTSSEDQIRDDYPEFYSSFLKKDTDFRYPDGETGEEVSLRVLEFLNECKSIKRNNICIVCHGGVIRSIISHFLDMPQYKRFNIFPYNCGISLIRFEEEKDNFKVITMNEITHLKEYQTF